MLRLRVFVLAVFLAATVLCKAMSPMVSVNYDMVDYLPEDAPATIALNIMHESYDTAVPNLRVMVRDVSIPQAMEYKSRIGALSGVDGITWLDDMASVNIPLEVLDAKTVADWYVDGNALFSVVINEENQQETLAAIREIIGTDGAMSGNPVDTANAQTSTGGEIQRMMLFIIPIMVFILMLTTTSWFSVLLFLSNVGIAILLNAGTNVIFGEISFITKATGTILQLACSMDYAIFLLDRFEETRAAGLEPSDAMAQAVSKSISSILSSGLTTVVGFAALIAMRFKVGPDMGYVLAKGICISLVTTLVFLPCLAICCYKLIDKTQHRSFMPAFAMLARGSNRFKGLVTVCVLLLLIPCYLAQRQIPFLYGTSGMAAPGSQVLIDRTAINEMFGQSATFALLLPKGDTAREQKLNDSLKEMPEVASVVSYVENVGKSIPEQVVPAAQLKKLNSDTYTRMIVTARVPAESAETFEFVLRLRALAQRFYPGTYHLVGECVNVYDMKATITADSVKVNLIAIGAIAVILLFTFRSLTLPILLLITIESSIFINVAVPYFMAQKLNYIGYLVISSIQLGATIDYAILFTNRYYENRAVMTRKQTTAKTVQNAAGSILTSAGVMTTAGLVLGLVSTNGVISQLGILIARGASLSAVLVLVLLPALLTWMEPVIQRTTRNMNFYQEPAKRGKELSV